MSLPGDVLKVTKEPGSDAATTCSSSDGSNSSNARSRTTTPARILSSSKKVSGKVARFAVNPCDEVFNIDLSDICLSDQSSLSSRPSRQKGNRKVVRGLSSNVGDKGIRNRKKIKKLQGEIYSTIGRNNRSQSFRKNLYSVRKVPQKRLESSDSELYARCKIKKKPGNVSDECGINGNPELEEASTSSKKEKLQPKPANYEEFIAELKLVQGILTKDKQEPDKKGESIEIAQEEVNLKSLIRKSASDPVCGTASKKNNVGKRVTFDFIPVKKQWSSLKEELQYNVELRELKKKHLLNRTEDEEDSCEDNRGDSTDDQNGSTLSRDSKVNKDETMNGLNLNSNSVSSIIEQFSRKSVVNENRNHDDFRKTVRNNFYSKRKPNKAPAEQGEIFRFKVPKVFPRISSNGIQNVKSYSSLSDSSDHNKEAKSSEEPTNDKFFGVRSAGDGGDCDLVKSRHADQGGTSKITCGTTVIKRKSGQGNELLNTHAIENLQANLANGHVIDHLSELDSLSDTSSEELSSSSSGSTENHPMRTIAPFVYQKQMQARLISEKNKLAKEQFNLTILENLKNRTLSNDGKCHQSLQNSLLPRCFPHSLHSNQEFQPSSDSCNSNKNSHKKKPTVQRSKPLRRKRSVSSYRSKQYSSSSSSEEMEDDGLSASGTIRCLEDLTRFRQLEIVTLRNNGLQTFPRAVFGLPLLKKLNLDLNFISLLPADLHALSGLERLSLNHNRLKSLDRVTNMAALNTLLVVHNRIRTGLVLASLPALTCLELSNNSLDGSLLETPPDPPRVGGPRRSPAPRRPLLRLGLSINLLKGDIKILLQNSARRNIITAAILNHHGA